MSSRLFEGLHHADLYAKYRPNYPQQVIDRILTFMKVKAKRSDDYVKAVDVGCGSGQLTRDLAPYFQQTVGVDVSEAQIKFARNLKTNANVEYRVGSGESIPVESSSVDLVTCAQSVHWFNFNKFCGEVDRILKPSGCVALIGYTAPNIIYQGKPHQGLNRLFDEYIDLLKPYTAKEIQALNNKYRDLKLPYAINERDDSFTRKREVNLTWFFNTLTSWSPYQNLMKATEGKSDPLVELKAKMVAEVDDKSSTDEIEVVLVDSIFMLLGAKPMQD
ncbi:putative methyltransferase DDB_G0268948 isoform X2 [Anneissia japonica]|uniref:putative methyltransferase DDB_G0268948 isoform X2 n=1 Tax=Anneissia japonica TaxID=1529436 RepID=UPI0014255089|nr:putative methyltransferase DDB_G0268948 isoform X2 [Anneissia japonica]